jgi:2-dehydro-3-deoxygluconokinase
MAKLAIPPASATGYDLLALGALVTRLDPGIVPFSAAERYDLHVSGGEYNVAADLALCFGMKTAVASAMVDYPIGRKVRSVVRASGVEGHYVEFKHDGVRGPNIAQVWSDRGQGLRAPVVFYNRANEAAALLGPGSFDWKAIFGRGLRWFHSGGIFAALSATTPELVIEAMKAAHDLGAIVSFDLNYRAKLWSAAGDDGPSRARKTLGRIVDEVDVLLGNEEDLQAGLGLAGPDIHGQAAVAGKPAVAGQPAPHSKLDPAAFLATIEEVRRRYPKIKAVATTLREVKSTNRHGWSAVLWLDGKSYVAPTCELDVYDRVGGGDGFAAGLIFGLLEGRDPDEALRLGWAHGALVTSFPGDTTMATAEQVEALARGGSARIQR